MKLIVIYGPPAVGKLTVAKAVSEQTGYKLFHNHLSRDLVRSLFPSSHPRFSSLVEKIRLELIEEAAREDVEGVIFTLVYDPKEDADFLKSLDDIAKRHDVQIYYVQLKTDHNTLLRRVVDESRRAHSKISSAETLGTALSQNSWLESVPSNNNLILDNTDLSPEDTAREIISFTNK